MILQPHVDQDIIDNRDRLMRALIDKGPTWPMTAQQHLALSYRLRAQSFAEEAHYFAKRNYTVHDDEHVKHCRAQAASYMNLADEIESAAAPKAEAVPPMGIEQAFFSEEMDDKLDMAAINALPHPLVARMVGGSRWPVYDIDAATGCMRLDVVGKLDHSHFCEVMELIDGNGDSHDPEMFWTDYEAKP